MEKSGIRGREAFPVVMGRPLAGQRVLVLAGTVAGIALPAEARIVARQIGHQPVARDLGKNRGGGNRQHLGVAADDGFGWYGQVGDPVAVDQNRGRRHRQGGDCALHRQHGGAENIQGIDFVDIGAPQGKPGLAGIAGVHQGLEAVLARAFAHRLRIVESGKLGCRGRARA
jgi:hypothetical protein